jgi:peptidoglycan-associated lipoprotein
MSRGSWIGPKRVCRQRLRGNRVRPVSLVAFALTLSVVIAGCAQRQAPLEDPAPPSATAPPVAAPASQPDVPLSETAPVLSEVISGPIEDDGILSRSLDELNSESPLSPAFFGVDSAELDDGGREVVAANAATLEMFPTWTVTIEGHCDERGTAEYNLALGERRAVAVKMYLVSLGIAADRVLTVSYGKEFPFDAGHDDQAWAQNRRGNFVITSK